MENIEEAYIEGVKIESKREFQVQHVYLVPAVRVQLGFTLSKNRDRIDTELNYH